MHRYKPGTNLWARVVRIEEQLMGRDGKQDDRRTIRRAQAEIDALYPGLVNITHPLHHPIVGAMWLADANGGRIPADTPPLGATYEALVRRDRAVTLPPRDPAEERLVAEIAAHEASWRSTPAR